MYKDGGLSNNLKKLVKDSNTSRSIPANKYKKIYMVEGISESLFALVFDGSTVEFQEINPIDAELTESVTHSFAISNFNSYCTSFTYFKPTMSIYVTCTNVPIVKTASPVSVSIYNFSLKT